MTRIFKDLHLHLLQRNSATGAGVPRLRSGPAAAPDAQRRKEAVRPREGSRLGVLPPLLALLALSFSFWVADGRDLLLVRLGYRSVAPLPDPTAVLSLDDQARYWTFALYDFDSLKRRYRVSGYFSIDPERARLRLERLLPHVSPAAAGEISAYHSIAYHAVPRPRPRP